MSLNLLKSTKRNPLAILIIFMGLMGALFGCGTMGGTPKPIIKYALNYPSENVTSPGRAPAVIKITPFGSAPGYDSTHMIYAAGPLERNAYVYSRWFSPPAEMVAYAIAKDLRASNAVAAVTLPGDRIKATHVLNGGITDFYEKDNHNKWYAVLGVSILLFSESDIDLKQEILLQKQYNAEVECKTRDAAAFAAAMNRAVRSVSNQIIDDIYHAFEAEQPVSTED